MGLPYDMAGNIEFIVDQSATGGGGGHSSDMAMKGPLLPGLPAATIPAATSALHKMLAELSYGQHLKSDILPPSRQFTAPIQPPQFTPLPDYPTASSATNWVRQLHGSLPGELYHNFGSSGPKDIAARHHCFPQQVSLNSGPLVLDTARGELVNSSKMTPKEILEAKALAASKSHSEAERRRRERINTHLATLRTLLPSSTKTDKASLLAEVIDQVKTLKRQVSEIYEYGPVPTDHDDVTVESISSAAEGRILIRASLCCEDRPELMTDLKVAIESLRLRTVKAEISTLGGRIKNVFLVTLKDDATEPDEDLCMKHLREVLKAVMEGAGGGELSPGSSNKRQRAPI